MALQLVSSGAGLGVVQIVGDLSTQQFRTGCWLLLFLFLDPFFFVLVTQISETRFHVDSF